MNDIPYNTNKYVISLLSEYTPTICKNPTQSIDFTKKVNMTLTSAMQTAIKNSYTSTVS